MTDERRTTVDAFEDWRSHPIKGLLWLSLVTALPTIGFCVLFALGGWEGRGVPEWIGPGLKGSLFGVLSALALGFGITIGFWLLILAKDYRWARYIVNAGIVGTVIYYAVTGQWRGLVDTLLRPVSLVIIVVAIVVWIVSHLHAVKSKQDG